MYSCISRPLSVWVTFTRYAHIKYCMVATHLNSYYRLVVKKRVSATPRLRLGSASTLFFPLGYKVLVYG